MRRRLLPLVAVALVLVGATACTGRRDAADAGTGTSVPAVTLATEAPATATSSAPAWRTEVATATVPEVTVMAERPAGATDPTPVGPTTTVPAAATQPAPASASGSASKVADIPRSGYLSAGVRKTSDGWAFANPTYFGNPLVFVVAAEAGDWLEVRILARPNQQEGWVKRSDVSLSEHQFHLTLTKSTFHLQAWDGDLLLVETDVVIGKDSSYTPVGTFFLTEKIARPPGGAYGPWILATSAYSETLESFDGGLPQVAFHGTNNPGLIGTKASNGCVRMPNDVDGLLADTLPAGTPITITD